MRRPKEKLIAGIDLHSNNVMIGVINQARGVTKSGASVEG
jgi:hypothetical protein